MKKVKAPRRLSEIKPIPRTAIYVGLKPIGRRKMRDLRTITAANALPYFKRAKWLEIGGVEEIKEISAREAGSMRLEVRHNSRDQGQKHLRVATAGVGHYPFKVAIGDEVFFFAGQPFHATIAKLHKGMRLFDVHVDSMLYEAKEPSN